MQLYTIRGGSRNELENRQYTIGVGISLGNKWFSPENIISLTEWALPYTKDHVVVYVADSIHAINIEVRDGKSAERAMAKALRSGTAILEEVKRLADQRFSNEHLAKIVYGTWEGFQTPHFKESVDFLYKKYANDELFKKTILDLIEEFTKRGEKNFTQEEKEKLGTYIVEELPEILARTPINDVPFDAHIYPFDSKLTELAERIQIGDIFPDIKAKMINTEPKIFLEVRE